MKKKPQDNPIVFQSNPLIESYYKLPLMSQRIWRKAISMIKPTDVTFKKAIYSISVKELIDLFGLQRRDIYSAIKEASRLLMRCTIKIQKEGDSYLEAVLFASTEYFEGEGRFEFEFSSKLESELLWLIKKGYFTSYELKQISGLRSQYSIRIYELLKQYLSVGWRIIELTKLRSMLGIEVKQYQQWNDFKRRVIERAKTELPNKTDLQFTYEIIKDGRKVSAIKFNIESCEQSTLSEKKEDSSVPEKILYKIPTVYQKQKSLLKVIATYLKTHDKEYIIRNIEYANKNAKDNYPKYLKDALKNSWAPEQVDLSLGANTTKIEPGMMIKLDGKEYTVDDGKCIFTGDGCLPEGSIRNLVEKEKAKVIS